MTTFSAIALFVNFVVLYFWFTVSYTDKQLDFLKEHVGTKYEFETNEKNKIENTLKYIFTYRLPENALSLI